MTSNALRLCRRMTTDPSRPLHSCPPDRRAAFEALDDRAFSAKNMAHAIGACAAPRGIGRMRRHRRLGAIGKTGLLLLACLAGCGLPPDIVGPVDANGAPGWEDPPRRAQ